MFCWRKEPKVEYRVIEADTTPQVTLEGQELQNSLRALKANPGFSFLLQRLRAQRRALEGRLKGTKFERLEEVIFLQSGVFWAGWLDGEITRLTAATVKPLRDPRADEQRAFEDIDRQLERVGK